MTGTSSKEIKNRLASIFDELLRQNGYGQLLVERLLLHHGQKEVIPPCSKEYRFVVESAS